MSNRGKYPREASKPPLGLKPRWLAVEERFSAVKEAIKRRLNPEKAIPDEWLKEYESLRRELNVIRSRRNEDTPERIAEPEPPELTSGELQKELRRKIKWRLFTEGLPGQEEDFIEGRYTEDGKKYGLRIRIHTNPQKEMIFSTLLLGASYRKGGGLNERQKSKKIGHPIK